MNVKKIQTHIVASLIAGIVALLPVLGVVITIVYFEKTVAGVWLKDQGFYFFGLGLIIAVIGIYLVGLTVTTFVGRWLWRRVDLVLERLPILGGLYQTLKQILGYGDGPKGIFQRVVLVTMETGGRSEIGLVTREACDETGGKVVVFVPSAPTPTSGRLLYVEPQYIETCDLTSSQAMQLLVSLGTVEAALKPRT